MCGLPGSGKSTFVREYLKGVTIISRDFIRYQLGLTNSIDEKVVGSKEEEDTVTNIQNKLIKSCIDNDQDFVIDGINNITHRKELIEGLNKRYVIGVNIKTTLEKCIEARKGKIPEEVLRESYSDWVYICSEEVVEVLGIGRSSCWERVYIVVKILV
jgi:predicted kinase